jgi:hypothetical protein
MHDTAAARSMRDMRPACALGSLRLIAVIAMRLLDVCFGPLLPFTNTEGHFGSKARGRLREIVPAGFAT